MLRHGRIYKGLVFLNIESRVGKIALHIFNNSRHILLRRISQPSESRTKITEADLTERKMLLKHYIFKSILTSVNPVWLGLVTPPGRTWKQFWESMERMSDRLEVAYIKA